MFYTYIQNSQGATGYIINENVAEVVIIEADTADEANKKAEQLGIYFDGCVKGIDCNCCGDRWEKVEDDEGTETPMIYDKSVNDYDVSEIWGSVYIYYKNGLKKVIK